MAIQYLDPLAPGANDQWTLQAGSTKALACTRPDDDTTTYIQTTGGNFTQDFTLTQKAGIIAINTVTLVARMQITNFVSPSNEQVQANILLNGNLSTNACVLNTTAPTIGWTTVTSAALARPGGGSWTVADLANLQIRLTGPYSSASSTVYCTTCYVQLDCVLAPAKIGAARDVGSRIIGLFRRPIPVATVKVPLLFVDLDLADDLALVHFAGPHPTGEGWVYSLDGRRRVKKLGEDLDLDALTLNLRLLDPRDIYLTFWDTMIAEEPPSFAASGIARLDPGALRSFSRASLAWVEDAAVAKQGGVQVTLAGTDVEKLTTIGELFEAAVTNEVIQSSFKNALTGWTTAGTGSNGSAVAADTSDLLFTSTESGNSVKFTAGNPIHIADLELVGTATRSFGANTNLCLSIDHKDDNGSALSYAVQRAFDSNWWRESDQTWQAAKTWNPMTVNSGTWVGGRYITKTIASGANATTMTVRVGIPTATGVAGQINHLGHVQLETGTYATSRLVTQATTVTRALDNFSVTNNHGRWTYEPWHGAAGVKIVPLWNSSDLPSGSTRVIASAYFDANNYDLVDYDQTTGAFRYTRSAAGAVTRATKVMSVTRGTTYRIAWRWTGSDAELGLTAYTQTIMINSVKGTDVVGALQTQLPAAANLRFGMDQTPANHADAAFQHARVTRTVLADAELDDLVPA